MTGLNDYNKKLKLERLEREAEELGYELVEKEVSE